MMRNFQMTEKEINSKAFQLISLLSPIKNQPNLNKAKSELIGSAKERGFLDWSGKLIDYGIVERSINHADEPTTICISIDNKKYGFNEANYNLFKALIEDILLTEYFKNKVSFKFIERKAFDWIIEIHSSKIARNSILDFLKDEYLGSIREYLFHFPVLNLEIDTHFKIGNVEFTYFTKDFFENLYNDLQNDESQSITKKDFETIFSKEYKGQVLAKICVKSEKEFAQTVAQTEAALSVDILKIYGLTTTIPEKRTMFDLNYRLNYQMKFNYLSEEVGKKGSLSETLKFNTPPFCITLQQLAFANNNGLQTFSNFVILKKNDELYNLIIQGINLLASSLSNWDLHLRVINLITILESLLLKDEEDNDMERKVKARLSKIITNDFKEKEKLKILFTNIYQIRHKMVHKAIKLSINTKELITAQITIINLLLKLIQFNVVEKYALKAALIEKLNEIKS